MRSERTKTKLKKRYLSDSKVSPRIKGYEFHTFLPGKKRLWRLNILPIFPSNLEVSVAYAKKSRNVKISILNNILVYQFLCHLVTLTRLVTLYIQYVRLFVSMWQSILKNWMILKGSLFFGRKGETDYLTIFQTIVSVKWNEVVMYAQESFWRKNHSNNIDIASSLDKGPSRIWWVWPVWFGLEKTMKGAKANENFLYNYFKKWTEKSRKLHNHKPQPTHVTKRKQKKDRR